MSPLRFCASPSRATRFLLSGRSTGLSRYFNDRSIGLWHRRAVQIQAHVTLDHGAYLPPKPV